MSDSVWPRRRQPTGSPVPGILQARILEWVAISFSNAWKWKVKVKSLSRVLLLVTPWTAAYQAPPSMGLSRQEYWSGVLLPSLNCTGRINKNDYCFLRKETKRLESEGRQLLTVHLFVCFLTFVSFACIMLPIFFKRENFRISIVDSHM